MFRKHVKPSKWIIRNAMRKAPTPAEKALRRALNASTPGTGFRWQFQAICAGYILDFYCASVRVAVEVDGSSHDGRKRHDETRDAKLRDQFKIITLRFTNEQVLADPAGIVSKVSAFCRSRETFRSWNAGLKHKKERV